MTVTRARELESQADERRKAGAYHEAAEAYEAAAFECLGDSPGSKAGGTVSSGAELLLEATLCYALAGRESERANRSRIGVLVAENAVEHLREQDLPSEYDRAKVGAWCEFVGDFRLIGGLGGYDEWYDQAEQVYRDAGDPSSSLAEQAHLNLFTFYRLVRRGVGVNNTQEATDGVSLTKWLSLKRSDLPSDLSTLMEREPQWD